MVLFFKISSFALSGIILMYRFRYSNFFFPQRVDSCYLVFISLSSSPPPFAMSYIYILYSVFEFSLVPLNIVAPVHQPVVIELEMTPYLLGQVLLLILFIFIFHNFLMIPTCLFYQMNFTVIRFPSPPKKNKLGIWLGLS